MKTGFDLMNKSAAGTTRDDVVAIQSATMVWVAHTHQVASRYAHACSHTGGDAAPSVILKCMRYMCMRGITVDETTWPAIEACKTIMQRGGGAQSVCDMLSVISPGDTTGVLACSDADLVRQIDHADSEYQSWVPSNPVECALKDTTDMLQIAFGL